MMFRIHSHFGYSVMSVISPHSRIPGLLATGWKCTGPRSRSRFSSGCHRLSRMVAPYDRPPLNVENAITQGPLARRSGCAVVTQVTERGEVELPLNPETRPAKRSETGNQQRVLVLYVLDTSPSEADHQKEIFASLRESTGEMKADPVTAHCTEVCVVEFNTDVVVSPFVSVADFTPLPKLPVGGGTHLGHATAKALDAIEARTAELRKEGVQVKRKLMIILSDFCTQDSLGVLTERLHPAEKDGNFAVLPVGVGQVNLDVMNSFSSKRRGQLLREENGTPNYKALFNWIKLVVGLFSRSQPGESVETPSTRAWTRL
jgi:uncharacterized protein YegL